MRGRSAKAATVEGVTYYFDPAARVIDVSDINVQTLQAVKADAGDWFVIGDLTPAGGKKFAAWTAANLNKPIGIFVDGRLLSAPIIRSRIESAFAIDGNLTKAQADEIVRRLRAGGR